MYLHPRDDQGALKAPAHIPKHVGPRDDRDRLAVLHRTQGMIAAGQMRASPEMRERLAARIAELEARLHAHPDHRPSAPADSG